jgi:hypothetical protein
VAGAGSGRTTRRRGRRRPWAAVEDGDGGVGAAMDLSWGTEPVNGGRRKEREEERGGGKEIRLGGGSHFGLFAATVGAPVRPLAAPEDAACVEANGG